MGCDIHGFVEYECSAEHPQFFAAVRIQRNYALFELLAGVRGRIENAVVPPRGIPHPLSWRVEDEYYLRVEDDERFQHKSGYCSPQNAARWLASGLSLPHPTLAHRVSGPDWHTPSWLTANELAQVQERYAVLLTDDPIEFESAMAQYRERIAAGVADDEAMQVMHQFFDRTPTQVPVSRHVELEAILRAVEALPSARFVFWFDN